MADWTEDFKKKLGESGGTRKKIDMGEVDRSIKKVSEQVEQQEKQMQDLSERQDKLLRNINQKVENLKVILLKAREILNAGQYREALPHWREVMKLDPGNLEAKEAMALIESRLPQGDPAQSEETAPPLVPEPIPDPETAAQPDTASAADAETDLTALGGDDLLSLEEPDPVRESSETEPAAESEAAPAAESADTAHSIPDSPSVETPDPAVESLSVEGGEAPAEDQEPMTAGGEAPSPEPVEPVAEPVPDATTGSSTEAPPSETAVEAVAAEDGEGVAFSEEEIESLLNETEGQEEAMSLPEETTVSAEGQHKTPLEDAPVPAADTGSTLISGSQGLVSGSQGAMDADVAVDFSQDEIDGLIQGGPVQEERATAELQSASETPAEKEEAPPPGEVGAMPPEPLARESEAPPPEEAATPTPKTEGETAAPEFSKESFLASLETSDEDLIRLEHALDFLQEGDQPVSSAEGEGTPATGPAAPSPEAVPVATPSAVKPPEKDETESTADAVLQDAGQVVPGVENAEAELEATLAEIKRVEEKQVANLDKSTREIPVQPLGSESVVDESLTLPEEVLLGSEVEDFKPPKAQGFWKTSKVGGRWNLRTVQVASGLGIAACLLLVVMVFSRTSRGPSSEKVMVSDAVIGRVEAKLNLGRNLLQQGDMDQAVSVLMTLSEDFPPTATLQRYLLEAADLVYLEIEAMAEPDPRLYQQAARLYEKLIDQFPRDETTETAYFRAAACYEMQGLLNRAGQYYGVLVQYYPESMRYEEAILKKADMDLILERFEEARATLLKIIREAPESYAAKIAQLKIARSFDLEARKLR